MDNNYYILFQLLDRDCIVEYYVSKDGERLVKKSMLKSEVYDYLVEHNYQIIDVSVTYDNQFNLDVK